MKRSFLFFALFFSSLIFLSGCYTHFQVQTRERTYESVVADSAQETTLYQSLLLRSELYPFPYPSYPRYWYPYQYYGNYWNNNSRSNGFFFGLYWNTNQFGYWDYWNNKPWNWYPPKWVNPNLPKIPDVFRPPIRTRDNSGERGFNRGRDNIDRSRGEIKKPPEPERNPPPVQNERKQIQERKRETTNPVNRDNPPSQRDNTRQGSERSNTERKR